MKRVYIICEGQSEEAFVKHILSQHFENLQIYLTPIIIPTSRKQKGWGLNYDRVKFFITNTLIYLIEMDLIASTKVG